MREQDKFSEWYRQRFNSMRKQPPDEVWNNISKELDINEVWSKVDSRLNGIERKKIFIRRTGYVSFLFFLFFMLGAIVFKAYKNAENQPIIAMNGNNRLISDVASPGNPPISQQGRVHVKFPLLPPKALRERSSSERKKEGGRSRLLSGGLRQKAKFVVHPEEKGFIKSSDYQAEKNISKSSYEKFPVGSFSQTRKRFSAKPQEKKSSASINEINAADPTIIFSKNTSRKNKAGDFLTVSLPALLISVPARDSFVPYFTSLIFPGDSNFYAQTPVNNSFHGFYSGGIVSLNNMWLLNQFTIDGLKANTLDQTKIGFGCAYGISAGYNFNTHYGAELNWYINSPEGQTYNLYDEGSYVTKRIRMDISVVSLSLKCRKEGYNTWLKTPKSHNVLIGLNLGIFKRDRSSLELDDNDDDIDVYEIMDTHYKHVSYGVIIGYEYEILAFHKIILSSALIGKYGLNNIFAGNGFIPESFNRTHAASLGINLTAKYVLK